MANFHEHQLFELDGFSGNFSQRERTTIQSLFWNLFQIPFALLLIGITSTSISFIINFFVQNLWGYGSGFVSTIYSPVNWILFCSWCLLMAFLSSIFTEIICPEAIGGGIPEMKSILGGTIKPILLSWKLAFGKMLGLIFALSAGLSVGKEGPLIHISAAIADKLLLSYPFRNVWLQEDKRLELLACACASGVTATFGTPFGGVLFSIELTSSAYMVRNLPRAFLASVFSLIVFMELGIGVESQIFLLSEDQPPSRLVSPEPFPLKSSGRELLVFTGLGLLCGGLGVGFVGLVEALASFRNRFLNPEQLSRNWLSIRRLGMVLGAVLVLSPLLYLELSLGLKGGQHLLLDIILKPWAASLPPPSVLILGSYFLFKFFATAISVCLPLPVGLFTPVFLIGGVLGRLIGELLALHCPGLVSLSPWEVALIGSAAFSTGVTRAISTAVIVYELSGQPHIRLPLLVAVLSAYFLGNRITKSVYEVLMDTNGTPYLQDLASDLHGLPVRQVMRTLRSQDVLALDSSYRDAQTLLFAPPKVSHSEQSVQEGEGLQELLPLSSQLYHASNEPIPIVQSRSSMLLVGTVSQDDLKTSLKRLLSFRDIYTTQAIRLDSSPLPPSSDIPQPSPLSHPSPSSDPLDSTIQFVLLDPSKGSGLVPVSSLSSAPTSSWAMLPYSVLLDPFPYQMTDSTHLSKVDSVFRLLRLNQAYITRSGSLVGLITRPVLRSFLKERGGSRRPLDTLRDLCRMISRPHTPPSLVSQSSLSHNYSTISEEL